VVGIWTTRRFGISRGAINVIDSGTSLLSGGYMIKLLIYIGIVCPCYVSANITL